MKGERWTIKPCQITEDFEPGAPDILTPVKTDDAADCFVVYCNGEYAEHFSTRAAAQNCVKDMRP